MTSPYDGAVIRLVAYLLREAAGLDDHDEVSLSIGAEALRVLALRAANERDILKQSLMRGTKDDGG